MNPSPSQLLPKRILVAVDAEGLAAHAIQAGLELSRTLGAKIELVHAVGSALPHWQFVDDAARAAADGGIMTTAWKAMTAHVKKLLSDIGFKGASAEDLVRVIAGPPAKVVLDRARETGADLIVLGFHRRHGIVDFGSTVRAVLANAPKAVWIQATPVQRIQKILVPVDLSPDSLNALAHACAFAKSLEATVRTIHCFQSAYYVAAVWPEYPDFGAAYHVDDVRKASEAEFKKAMAAFDWMGVPHEYDFFDGEPVDKILELAKNVDLVVMGTHGRTGLSSVVLGNVAYSVLKRSPKPVMAIRHAERKYMT